jgi:hypothetical protein
VALLPEAVLQVVLLVVVQAVELAQVVAEELL